jgi:hypothetical protein
MKIRYAITHISKKDGFRKLAFANQGRHHFDNKEKAKEYLANMLKNNSINTLNSVYGDYKTLRVDLVECYDHGDAVRTIFND